MKFLFFIVVLLSVSFATVKGSSDCLLQHFDPEACLDIDECSYCIQEVYAGNRCNKPELLLQSGCLKDNILDEREDNCTVTPGIGVNCTVPIIPGKKINVTVTWELAQHPLDLYYLMDFSGSMEDDKENVVKLAAALNELLVNLSTDATLGFGTFVDKPTSPFGSGDDYSFRNDRKLSSDTSGFAELVAAIQIRHGGDEPESQSDAMYQVAACNSEIGWRTHSRRLLLLATDINWHKAGDGVGAGLTKPFDGNCHLNDSGFYTEELTMDYPSDVQLVNVLANTQNPLSVIFAVTSGNELHYKELAEKLTTSEVGVLSSDSSNIIELISTAYDKISSRFELTHNNGTKEIAFKYYSNCNGDTEEETTVCEKLSPDGKVTFIVEVDVEECPLDVKDWKQTIRFHPLGLPTYIDIALALICNL